MWGNVDGGLLFRWGGGKGGGRGGGGGGGWWWGGGGGGYSADLLELLGDTLVLLMFSSVIY